MIRIIPFKFPGISNVKCAFTTRRGGYSSTNFSQANLSFEVGDNPEHVRKNREMLFDKIKIDKLVELKQIHQDTLIEVKKFYTSPVCGDAMITQKINIGLLIKVADCQPVLIAHESGKYIGAFHVGWRANRGNFIKIWIKEFCQTYNIEPKGLKAVRGPSLGPANSKFINFFKEWPLEFVHYFNIKNKTLNLWALTREQLINAGLVAENIYSIDLCTYDLNEYFFSYRREKICGRQAGIIWKIN